MKISGSSWENYINKLRKVNDKAAEKMVEYLQTHEVITQGERKQMLDYAYGLATYYGEGAAELACQMYDAAAAAQGAKVSPAEPAETATYGETAKAVQGAMKQSDDPNVAGSAVGRLVKQAGVDTTMKNAIRDGAEWAWIPSGDTCAFCLTLASRGFQKASKKVLKGNHAEHIHADCDCTFFIRFDGKSTIEGYDPDALRVQYDAAEGDTPQEKINSLRREQYRLDKDRINAQKRTRYAIRTRGELSASASGLRPKFGAYRPDEERRKAIIKKGIEAEKPIFAGDLLGQLAKGLPPKDGWYDVVLHGWPYHMEFLGEPIDAETLCAIISQRTDYKKGTPIRLISCYTGSKDDGVAQYIANKLHVDVEAPDKKGIITKFFNRYDVYSGSEKGKRDGTMRVFHPKEAKVIRNEKGSSRVYY